MAEAVVTLFLGKLKALLTQEESLLAGVYDQVLSLVDELKIIQFMIGNADRNYRKSEAVRNWVKDVRNETYDAIDNFILEIERQRRIKMESKQRRRLAGFLRRVGFLKSHASIRRELEIRLGIRLEYIKSKIRKISESRLSYGAYRMNFFNVGEGTNIIGSNRLRGTIRTSDWECEPVGVEDDVKTLVRLLIGGEARRTVVSIIGMGGLGKTTLANNVYNSDIVKSHFECRAWVYVPQEFILKHILEGLLKQLLGVSNEMEKMDEEEQKKKLSVYLKEKIYLIVIDDICNREEWDGLKGAFPDAQNLSRILLTTRERDVALYSDPQSRPHELRFRNEDESWELFLQKVFPVNMDCCCLLVLENFGRRIVAKCGGLPLAIVVMAGLLLTIEKKPYAWYAMVNILNRELEEGDDRFKSILALSYDHLPYYLKPCFLYFGLFPQDFEFQTDKLIQMWVAEGFVQQRGEETMEEVAGNYLDELASCSMIQATRKSGNGRIKACRIHNLIRDFAILEAKESSFLKIYPNQDLLLYPSERRMVINNNFVYQEAFTPLLRSFFAININEELLEIVFKSLFSECKLLKVLDLHGSNISRLPGEIEDFINLRYLGLTFTGLVSLPLSIGNLHNLQTLDARGTSISSLPSSIGNLANLQSLDVRGTSINSLPASIGNLGNLQTLDVRDTSITSLPACIGNLWNLQTLDVRGTSIRSLPEEFWKIPQLRHVHMDEDSEIVPENLGMDCQLKNLQTLKYARAGNWINDMLANLSNIRDLCIMDMSSSHTEGLCESIAKLHLLTSLTLQGYDPIPTPVLSHLSHLWKLDLSVPLEKLPECHEFPPNLTVLHLLWSGLMQDPFSTLEQLPKLRALKVKANAYRGKRMGCSAGGFPQLQDLELAGLNELTKCRFEKGGMPRLKLLSIWDCQSMKMLPEGLEHLTSLQELRAFHMPREFHSGLQEKKSLFRFKIQSECWFSMYTPELPSSSNVSSSLIS